VTVVHTADLTVDGDWEDDILRVFRHLHNHPEVSGQEYATTLYLAQKMRHLGWEVKEWRGKPGFIADLPPISEASDCDGHPGGAQGSPPPYPVVAMRCDLDALWQEVDGTWRANHSCGHDAHMAAVYGAARALSRYPQAGIGYRAIFQPAEETGEGALDVIHRGGLDGVKVLFGLHLRPEEELPSGVFSAAIRNGAAAQVGGVIIGEASHGARPHQGVNPIEVLFVVQQVVATIHVNPMVPHSVKLTRVTAGGKSTNVIPERAEFCFDVRAQTNAVLSQLTELVAHRVTAVAESLGATAQVRQTSRVMAAEVGDVARLALRQAIMDAAGAQSLADDIVTPGGEDFHYYTAECPSLQAAMLGVGCGLKPGLHHPHMAFDMKTIPMAARILAIAMRDTGKKFHSMRDW